jgi:hypothetical protein
MKQPRERNFRVFGPDRSGAPVVPDRSRELIFLLAGGMLAALWLALMGYIWLDLQMPEAALSLLPVLIGPCLFIVPAVAARRKRLKAKAAFARFQEGVTKAFSEI